MGNKEKLEKIGIDFTRMRADHTLCPKCSHTRKKKNDLCLSVNIETGTYFCHNTPCDFNGGVSKIEYVPQAKEYTRPKFVNTTGLGDYWVNIFSSQRGIGQITLKKAGITESKGFDSRPLINFNYFRDGELINVKYRDDKKKFRLEKNAELIFYNLDAIKNSDWCIITEGEIDALSFIEAGINEVVSVPNGASISKKSNLEYLDNCISYFDNKTKIILATDDDEAGHSLREELARRLGYERCFKVNLRGYKDTNELLVAKSVTAVKQLIVEPNLISYPIDGIITADMMWDDMEDMFQNGLNKGATTGFLKDFDEYVSFVTGQLMVLTGIPNHGKSPFALMIMASLSLKHGWRWGLFSPEHKPLKIFIAKVCELLLGKKMKKGVGFTSIEKEIAKSFITEHFLFIEPEDENYTLENILDKAKKLVLQKGIKGLLIDPWNKLEHNLEKGENETNYISKALDKIIRFDQKNSVFSIVVAHPTKIRKVFKSHLFEVPSLYDISGSSNWFNKPDIGITFYRNFDTKKSEIYIQKMKYEHLGKQGKVEMRYNMNNGRFNNEYGDWDNSNWLIPNAEQTETKFPEPTFETNTEIEVEDYPF